MVTPPNYFVCLLRIDAKLRALISRLFLFSYTKSSNIRMWQSFLVAYIELLSCMKLTRNYFTLPWALNCLHDVRQPRPELVTALDRQHDR